MACVKLSCSDVMNPRSELIYHVILLAGSLLTYASGACFRSEQHRTQEISVY